MTRHLGVLLCATILASFCGCGLFGDSDDEEPEPGATKREGGESEGGGDEETGDDSAAVTEKVDLPEPTVVEGSSCDEPTKLTELAAHTVLSAKGGGCYRIDDVLRVRGERAKLAIEPGVTVQFAENAGLRIRKAAFEARGTKDEPIVLTGTREEPGFWKGVVVQESDRTDNVLEHVQILYAGGADGFDGVEPAALMFDDYHGKTSFTVRNAELSHSEGYGLYMEAETELELASNTMTSNGEGAVRAAPAAVGHLDADSTYTGNDQDRVVVGGGRVKQHEGVWPGIDVPYVIEETIRFRNESFLTLKAGATLKFAENAGLVFRKSKLRAEGKKDSPVTLTGKREIAGFWRGVLLRESDSVDNALIHTVISHAGAEKSFDGVEAPAALMFDDYNGTSSMKVHDSTLSNGAGYGLYVEADTELDFARNTLTGNAKGAAYVAPHVVGSLDGDSRYSGNETDRVTVAGGRVKGVEATWPAIDVPYFVEETVRFRNDCFVTIEAGATLAFAENQGLVFRKSKLKAEGTKDEPIRFAGEREGAGFWRGIVFRETNSVDNVLAHTAVADAGATESFDGVEPAALLFDDYNGPVKLTIDHVRIENSGSAGMHIEEEVELESDDCGTMELGDPPVTDGSRPFADVCSS